MKDCDVSVKVYDDSTSCTNHIANDFLKGMKEIGCSLVQKPNWINYQGYDAVKLCYFIYKTIFFIDHIQQFEMNEFS